MEYLKAFAVGGLICVIGQLFKELYEYLGLTEDVVKTLRKYKRDEDDYRKEAKANLVEIESYEENFYFFFPLIYH